MLKPEEIEAKIKEFSSAIETQKKNFESQIDTMKKDFELRLESSNREAQSWKDNAQKREEEVKQYQEQAAKSKKEAEEALAKARGQEFKAFVESLKREGRITPAQEEIVVKLMESMTSESAIASFKEKDGKTVSHTQLSLFRLLISSLPKVVSFSEVSYGEAPEAATPDGNQPIEHFQEVLTKNGGKQKLPVKGMDVAEKAEQYMEEMRRKGVVVSYADALIAVSPRKKVSA